MLVELEEIGKSFFTKHLETRALHGISLKIAQGEFVAIEGPSGCGKSTLLAILGLLDSPTRGKYNLNGCPVETLNAGDCARIRNREVGFIFQNFNLIGELSIQQNVDLPLSYRGMSRRERQSRVAAVLERVHMSHRADHYPMQLSGGEQQRVAVARALAGDPTILLADEPTGSLDSENGVAVMDLLSELHESGSTIIMVTHDARFARYANRTVGLLDGRIINDGHIVNATMMSKMSTER